eukprot:Rmarinus@m.28729
MLWRTMCSTTSSWQTFRPFVRRWIRRACLSAVRTRAEPVPVAVAAAPLRKEWTAFNVCRERRIWKAHALPVTPGRCNPFWAVTPATIVQGVFSEGQLLHGRCLTANHVLSGP